MSRASMIDRGGGLGGTASHEMQETIKKIFQHQLTMQEELKALRGQSKGTRKVFSRRMTSFAIDNLTQFNEALLALAQEEQHSVVSPTTLKAHQSLFQQVISGKWASSTAQGKDRSEGFLQVIDKLSALYDSQLETKYNHHHSDTIVHRLAMEALFAVGADLTSSNCTVWQGESATKLKKALHQLVDSVGGSHADIGVEGKMAREVASLLLLIMDERSGHQGQINYMVHLFQQNSTPTIESLRQSLTDFSVAFRAHENKSGDGLSWFITSSYAHQLTKVVLHALKELKTSTQRPLVQRILQACLMGDSRTTGLISMLDQLRKRYHSPRCSDGRDVVANVLLDSESMSAFAKSLIVNNVQKMKNKSDALTMVNSRLNKRLMGLHKKASSSTNVGEDINDVIDELLSLESVLKDAHSEVRIASNSMEQAVAELTRWNQSMEMIQCYISHLMQACSSVDMNIDARQSELKVKVLSRLSDLFAPSSDTHEITMESILSNAQEQHLLTPPNGLPAENAAIDILDKLSSLITIIQTQVIVTVKDRVLSIVLTKLRDSETLLADMLANVQKWLVDVNAHPKVVLGLELFCPKDHTFATNQGSISRELFHLFADQEPVLSSHISTSIKLLEQECLPSLRIANEILMKTEEIFYGLSQGWEGQNKAFCLPPQASNLDGIILREEVEKFSVGSDLWLVAGSDAVARVVVRAALHGKSRETKHNWEASEEALVGALVDLDIACRETYQSLVDDANNQTHDIDEIKEILSPLLETISLEIIRHKASTSSKSLYQRLGSSFISVGTIQTHWMKLQDSILTEHQTRVMCLERYRSIVSTDSILWSETLREEAQNALDEFANITMTSLKSTYDSLVHLPNNSRSTLSDVELLLKRVEQCKRVIVTSHGGHHIATAAPVHMIHSTNHIQHNSSDHTQVHAHSVMAQVNVLSSKLDMVLQRVNSLQSSGSQQRHNGERRRKSKPHVHNESHAAVNATEPASPSVVDNQSHDHSHREDGDRSGHNDVRRDDRFWSGSEAEDEEEKAERLVEETALTVTQQAIAKAVKSVMINMHGFTGIQTPRGPSGAKERADVIERVKSIARSAIDLTVEDVVERMTILEEEIKRRVQGEDGHDNASYHSYRSYYSSSPRGSEGGNRRRRSVDAWHDLDERILSFLSLFENQVDAGLLRIESSVEATLKKLGSSAEQHLTFLCQRQSLQNEVINNAVNRLPSSVVEANRHSLNSLIDKVITASQSKVEDPEWAAQKEALISNVERMVAMMEDGQRREKDLKRLLEQEPKKKDLLTDEDEIHTVKGTNQPSLSVADLERELVKNNQRLIQVARAAIEQSQDQQEQEESAFATRTASNVIARHQAQQQRHQAMLSDERKESSFTSNDLHLQSFSSLPPLSISGSPSSTPAPASSTSAPGAKSRPTSAIQTPAGRGSASGAWYTGGTSTPTGQLPPSLQITADFLQGFIDQFTSALEDWMPYYFRGELTRNNQELTRILKQIIRNKGSKKGNNTNGGLVKEDSVASLTATEMIMGEPGGGIDGPLQSIITSAPAAVPSRSQAQSRPPSARPASRSTSRPNTASVARKSVTKERSATTPTRRRKIAIDESDQSGDDLLIGNDDGDDGNASPIEGSSKKLNRSTSSREGTFSKSDRFFKTREQYAIVAEMIPHINNRPPSPAKSPYTKKLRDSVSQQRR